MTNRKWQRLSSIRAAAIALLLMVSVIHVGWLVASSVFAQGAAHVVINEVEMDPLGPDYGKKWVELYNPLNTTVDLSGWTLKTKSGSVVKIQAGVTIASKGYFVLTLPRITLVKTGDSLILLDSKSSTVDTTPILSETSDNDLTWQRFPNGKDTSSITDWRFAASTKGQGNGRYATTLALSASRTSVIYGDTITFSGKVNVTMTVNVTLSVGSSGSITNTTVATLNDGSFTYNWTPPIAGTYSITAFWNGDEFDDPATSQAIAIFVDKITTNLSIFPTALNQTDITPVTFTGTITPTIPRALVTISIRAPNGTVRLITVHTFDNGSFRYVFIPSGGGTWRLTASWAGDTNHYGDDSATFVTILNTRPLSIPILILELITIPVTLAMGVFIYKYGGPLGFPHARIRKQRAPLHLRPLRVLNGAICPLCFRPMMYEPKGADWHCEHCGVYYET